MGTDSYELGTGYSWAEKIRVPGRVAYEDHGKIVVREFPSGEGKELDCPTAGRHACPLAWSPDGRTLFHSSGGQVDAIDVDTGARHTLTAFPGGGKHAGVYWQLHCSPDGRRLLFLHHEEREGVRRAGIYSAATDASGQREVVSMESLWNFACSWEHDVLLASLAGKEPSLWRMDLEGRGARRILDGALATELQVAPDGEHAVYHLQSGVWSIDLGTGKATRIVDLGKVPALSPDGTTVAFQRGEHDLYVQSIGAEPRVVLAARDNDDTWRPFGWHRQPLWSPDGKLLLFWATTGKRHAESSHPEFVEELRKQKAAAEGRRRKKTKAGDRGHDISIELAHWTFEHAIGVVDLDAREVWMLPGEHWSNAAWGKAAR